MATKKIKTVLGEKKAPKPTKEQLTNWPTATVSNLPEGGKRWESNTDSGFQNIPRQPFENRKKNTTRFSKKKKL